MTNEETIDENDKKETLSNEIDQLAKEERREKMGSGNLTWSLRSRKVRGRIGTRVKSSVPNTTRLPNSPALHGMSGRPP